jgi:hypothetical protein
MANRKPTALLKLSGVAKNNKKVYAGRIDDKLPMVSRDTEIDPPEHFLPWTKERWVQTINWCCRAGIVSWADYPTLEAGFQALEDAHVCDMQIDFIRKARVGDIPPGGEIDQISKLSAQKYKALNYFSSTLGKFGITPADRAKLTINDLNRKAKEENPVLAVLQN